MLNVKAVSFLMFGKYQIILNISEIWAQYAMFVPGLSFLNGLSRALLKIWGKAFLYEQNSKSPSSERDPRVKHWIVTELLSLLF